MQSFREDPGLLPSTVLSICTTFLGAIIHVVIIVITLSYKLVPYLSDLAKPKQSSR